MSIERKVRTRDNQEFRSSIYLGIFYTYSHMGYSFECTV